VVSAHFSGKRCEEGGESASLHFSSIKAEDGTRKKFKI
jgi:hypothetical protein